MCDGTWEGCRSCWLYRKDGYRGEYQPGYMFWVRMLSQEVSSVLFLIRDDGNRIAGYILYRGDDSGDRWGGVSLRA